MTTKNNQEIILLTMSLTGKEMDTRVSILNDSTKYLDNNQMDRLNNLLSEVNDLLISSLMITAIENLGETIGIDIEKAIKLAEDKGKKRPPHLKVVEGKAANYERNN